MELNGIVKGQLLPRILCRHAVIFRLSENQFNLATVETTESHFSTLTLSDMGGGRNLPACTLSFIRFSVFVECLRG